MKEKYLQNLNQRILDNRLYLGLTQKQVAKQLGITYQSYQAYEFGTTVPTLKNFLRLCEVFELTPNDLLEY